MKTTTRMVRILSVGTKFSANADWFEGCCGEVVSDEGHFAVVLLAGFDKPINVPWTRLERV